MKIVLIHIHGPRILQEGIKAARGFHADSATLVPLLPDCKWMRSTFGRPKLSERGIRGGSGYT